MNCYRCITLCFAMLLVCGSHSAALVTTGPVPIEDRFTQADLVCICGVLRVDQLSAITSPSGKLLPADYTVVLNPLWEYKGLESAPVNVQIKQRDPMLGPPFLKNFVYLLFLRKQAARGYAADASGIPLTWFTDRVHPAGRGADGLQADIVSALRVADGSEAQAAIEALLFQFRSLSDAAVDALTNPSAPSPEVRIMAAALLARRDPPKWAPALLTLLASSSDATAGQLAQYEGVLGGIGDTISARTGTKQIPQLEELTNSRSRWIAISAMFGIRRIADRSTIPFLVGKLDSNDRDVQYEALVTLAVVTGKGGDFGPGKGPFEQNPEKYIRLWKEWWAAGGQ